MRIETFMDQQRQAGVRLCEALGLDPGKVIGFEWFEANPRKVRVVIFDGPTPDDRHVEEYDVPDDWQPVEA